MIKVSEFIRPEGSIDISINEIKEGESTVKIVGTVVSKKEGSIMIGDATGQIKVRLFRYPIDASARDMGRFLIRVKKTEDEVIGDLISYIPMNMEQIRNYKRIIDFEKRIPR